MCYLKSERCLHLILLGTNGNRRIGSKFSFFFAVVDKAPLCEGTDL